MKDVVEVEGANEKFSNLSRTGLSLSAMCCEERYYIVESERLSFVSFKPAVTMIGMIGRRILPQ